MASQKIKYIKVSELRLWSENPRDFFDLKANDYDIIKRALKDNPSNWNLDKMIKEMGNQYDFSEIPTVVYSEDVPVVYDGNRRVAVLKCLQNDNLYSDLSGKFPFNDSSKELQELKEIPCNVCDKDTALTNIERKHTNNGSWHELERDYFLHKHRGEPKSDFMIIEKQTKLISMHPYMNQAFVKDEVLTRKNLNAIGFDIQNEQLISNYDDKKGQNILEQIAYVIKERKITTRKNRGALKEVLQKEIQIKLTKFEHNKKGKIVNSNYISNVNKKTDRTSEQKHVFFGKKSLSLEKGDTNNLYRDVDALYKFYCKEQKNLSKGFINLIRMSLRLIVESAAAKPKIDDYVNENFKKAKEHLSEDQKFLLASQEVDKKKKLIKLLHMGAHKYIASANLEQTIAMSIIIGAMLEATHSKNNL